MAEETRNYIEQTQARAKAYYGREVTPDEMASDFAKSDLIARIEALDQLDRDFSGGELSINEAAKLKPYISALRNTNERLRKVGR